MQIISQKKSILIASLLVLLPYASLLFSVPIGRDSGTFMYTGMVIADGGLPYLDSWDHKGPILYLFNALGIYLFQSVRGVIALEGLLLFFALVFSIQVWSRWLTETQVMLASTLFVAAFYGTFEGGNLTESWLVPFLLVTYSTAFTVISNLGRNETTGDAIRLAMLLGVSFAVALLTRPNNGMGLMVLGIGLIYLCKGKRVQILSIMILSFALVAIPVIVWLFQQGAFEAFFEQYIIYNLEYSSDLGIRSRIFSAHRLLSAILFSPLGLITLAVGFSLMFKAKTNNTRKNTLVLFIFTAVFFADVLSQLVSGKGYLHYISLTTASMVIVLVSFLSQYKETQLRLHFPWSQAPTGMIVVFALTVSFLWPIHGILSPVFNGTNLNGTQKSDLISHLTENTTERDLVLVHGAETWLLAATGLRSPTSITYYYPAQNDFKDSFWAYQNEVLETPPAYIIEAPGACGLTLNACSGNRQDFETIMRLLSERYEQEIELHGFIFWRLREATL